MVTLAKLPSAVWGARGSSALVEGNAGRTGRGDGGSKTAALGALGGNSDGVQTGDGGTCAGATAPGCAYTYHEWEGDCGKRSKAMGRGVRWS